MLIVWVLLYIPIPFSFKSGDIITAKWHNIRDSFMKSLKKSGQATGRKHTYHDNLQFLLKVVLPDDTQSNIQDPQHYQQSQLDEIHDSGESMPDIEVNVQENVNARGAKAKAPLNPPKKARFPTKH